MRGRKCATLLSVAALAGCANPQEAANASFKAALAQSEVAALKEEVGRLNERVKALETYTSVDYDEASFAVFPNPTDPGFALGRSGFGKFAVSVANIQPYGAGSRMTLNVVNLASATLKNATFTVNYNQFSVKDRMEQMKSADPSDEKSPTPDAVTHSSTNSFPPNQWVVEVVSLPDLPPDKIKFVSVRFMPSVILASQ